MGIEELLARVYDDPRDVDARVVLADALQEAGDPRGELIALQYARAQTGGEPSKRERDLLKKHLNHFLGRLEPAIVKKERIAFELGFVARCAFRHHAKARERIGERAWSLVQWLDVGQDSTSALPLLTSEPIRRWLRTAWRVRTADFEALAAGPHTFAWKEIALTIQVGESDAVADAVTHIGERFPELERLLLGPGHSWRSPGVPGHCEAVARILRSPLGAGLEELVLLEGMGLRSEPIFGSFATGDRGPRRLVLAGRAGRLTVHRAANSASPLRADVHLVVGGAPVLCAALVGIPRGRLANIRVTGHTHSHADMRELDEAARVVGAPLSIASPADVR